MQSKARLSLCSAAASSAAFLLPLRCLLQLLAFHRSHHRGTWTAAWRLHSMASEHERESLQKGALP